MVAIRNYITNFFNMRSARKSISIVSIFFLFANILLANSISSTPVFITGDSNGAWIDSFEDDTGLEDILNLSIENGEVSLSLSEPFDPLIGP